MARSQAAIELFPAPDHDHQSCADSILAEAERICAARRVRLTPKRRQVLEIIAKSHAAAGAYEILEEMAGPKGRPAPVIVYRALEFLMTHGLVHRLASLNAFIACANPQPEHGAQFLICRGCRTVTEFSNPAMGTAIRAGAREAGFSVEASMVEISGLCAACAQAQNE